MANQKPMTGARIVPLDLPIERRLILRREIEACRDGVREDLKDPSKLRDPERARRLGASFERLLEALASGRVELPDEEARAALQAAADGFDDAERWEETKAIHDAHRALLAVFGSREEEEAAPADGIEARRSAHTTEDEDLAMQSAVLRRVLDAHPARLTEHELVRGIVGKGAPRGDRGAVERAAWELGGAGLLHASDQFVTPTRAALRFQELIDA